VQQREVIAVLKLATDVRDQAEAGHEMTEREYRLPRELLDAQARRRDYSKRFRQLEQRADQLERRVLRPSCGEKRAWRDGRCIDVAASPR
jgi:hypothetical protein